MEYDFNYIPVRLIVPTDDSASINHSDMLTSRRRNSSTVSILDKAHKADWQCRKWLWCVSFIFAFEQAHVAQSWMHRETNNLCLSRLWLKCKHTCFTAFNYDSTSRRFRLLFLCLSSLSVLSSAKCSKNKENLRRSVSLRFISWGKLLSKHLCGSQNIIVIISHPKMTLTHPVSLWPARASLKVAVSDWVLPF